MTKITAGLKRIGALVYTDCIALDLTGPIEAFNFVNLLARETLGRSDCGYQIELIGAKAGPVTTMSGVKLYADHGFDDYDQSLNMLLVPGMKPDIKGYMEDGLATWVGKHAAKCERVVCICSGALILAQAGLLAGHKVTTHWRHGDIIRDNFTDIEVDDANVYRQSGNIYSSAGLSAGIDLALTIIEEDYGRPLALNIAKQMVMYSKRSGSQNQFSHLLASQSKAQRFAGLIDWIEENLSNNLSVCVLAERCAMSKRNFSRHFALDVGYSPMQYINSRRLAWARLLLENSNQPLANVADTTGFSTQASFCSAFRASFDTTPAQYRKKFH